MIFISSSCSKNKYIHDSVKELVENGFRNIELSGGTKYFDGFEKQLIKLKKQYDLNYIIHNYFPPPRNEFVLNLASLDDAIYEKSYQHIKKSIELAKRLDISVLGFHAGYFIDPSISEIGKALSRKSIDEKTKAVKRFCRAYESLKKYAKNITLYIENNVYSIQNFKTFGNQVPLMLTSIADFFYLKRKIDFNILLDVGHLFVSSKTLAFDFDNALNEMIETTDYLHLSNNDGLFDQNLGFTEKSELLNVLKTKNLKNKVITLEIYSGMVELKKSYNIIKKLNHPEPI